MRRILVLLALVAAAGGAQPSLLGAAVESPTTLALPDGFQPEGIVLGRGTTFFVGSLANGAIYRGDTKTGDGGLLVAASSDGAPAVGLAFDRGQDRLFVAGGGSGTGRVYDAESGDEIARVPLTSEPSFVNDVVVARDAVWFTDSRRPALYKMSLDDPTAVEEVVLGGDFAFDPEGFNANGITTLRGGRVLLIVHSPRGELYRVDPASGEAALVDLGGEDVTNGDGLVSRGRAVYVVRNRDNEVAVVRLDRDLSAGSIERVITDPAFRIPTTADLRGRNLFVVNARFGTPVGPEVDYDVVRVRA